MTIFSRLSHLIVKFVSLIHGQNDWNPGDLDLTFFFRFKRVWFGELLNILWLLLSSWISNLNLIFTYVRGNETYCVLIFIFVITYYYVFLLHRILKVLTWIFFSHEPSVRKLITRRRRYLILYTTMDINILKKLIFYSISYTSWIMWQSVHSYESFTVSNNDQCA